MTRSGETLWTPVDSAGLGVFRVLFGLLLFGAVVRFVAYGWVSALYLAPSYHFTYAGFEWVRTGPAWFLYGLFCLMGIAALGIASGLLTRVSAAVFCLAFTYVELIDKTTYLNHYYFVSLVTFLLIFVPTSGAFSLDAWRGRAPRQTPLLAYALLRFQLGVVYFFAGFAKLNGDWLLRGEPLRTWLASHADVPVVGPWLAAPSAALVLSWAGALFDLSVPLLFGLRRTRLLAYLAAVAFHVITWLLFPIGIFPWVMLASATLFFSPSWPRRFVRFLEGVRFGGGERFRRGMSPAPTALTAHTRVRQAALGAAVIYAVVQLAVPLRFLLHDGWVNWTDCGFRFAWRVMLIEKSGFAEFNVVAGGRSERISPRGELTQLQYRMMSTQPDMIAQYARHLADGRERETGARPRVFAQAWASLNGRPSTRLVDPRVDVSVGPPPDDWILPLDAPTRR